MTCAACGSDDLRPDDRFCPQCGTSCGDATCAACGAELRAGAQFCTSCGLSTSVTRMPSEAQATSGDDQRRSTHGASERRLTSVLFADLVSYTTLAESRDTEDVRDLLSRYFEVCTTVVRRYGGAVEKFIGDAVMAVWGVPSAHEDDAERAVRAALELVSGVAELAERTGLPDLAVRAGVVTGEVSTTVGATDQGMVAGDPVNTASRVQSAAGPGQVWVDANTRALTAAAITYTDEGQHQLKGKAEPVQLFRAGSVVAGVGGLQRVDGLEAPLAGRDRELRLVKELFHATEESGRPRLVVVDGEPGVGKSRLAWEFSKYVDGLSSDVMWHQGRCLSYGDGAAYWALAEAVRARLGLVEESTSGESSDALDRSLRQLVADDDERVWMQPRLASLLGQGGSFSREDLFAAWARFFERLADGDRTVVLVVDDGQYADDGFLDFLDELVTSGRKPIFVLLLARPELMERRPALGGRRATVVNLEPLPDDAMTALVDGLVEGLPAAAREQLVSRAEGVPLYAVETVRALVDRDLVVARGGRYVVDESTHLDLSDIEAPASLHALVAARLDALTPGERQVVADASVLGLSFTREGIDVLSGHRPDLDAVLASLARKEVVATETDRFSAERGHYRFVQSVVRQVAYSTLSRRDRKQKHLLVAEHLAAQTERADELAVVVAQHLVDALDVSGTDDVDAGQLHARATHHLRQAAARACALGSYSDALRLYRLAIEHSDVSTRRELLEHAAETALIVADYPTVLQLSQEALLVSDAAGDPLLSARAVQLYGQAMIYGGDAHGALDLLDARYSELLTLPGSAAARQRVLHPIVLALMFTDPANARTLDLAHERVRLAEKLQDVGELTQAMANLATVVAYQGSNEVAEALFLHVVERSRQVHDWRSLAVAQNNLVDLRMATSPGAAIEVGEAGVATARDHGLYVQAEGIAFNLGMALWSSGRWDRLDALMQELVDPSEPHDPQGRTAVMALDLWRCDAGLRPFAEQAPLVATDDLQDAAWQEHLLMLRHRVAGEWQQALAMAEALLVSVGNAGITDGDFFMMWSESTRTALLAGDLTLARRLLTAVEEREPGEVTPALKAHLLMQRGTFTLADGGDPVSAEADLRDGIHAFETFDSPPYRARTQAALGRWLTTQGRDDEASVLLEQARRTYDELGASTWLAELDQAAAVTPG